MDNYNACESAWLNGYIQGRQGVEKCGPIDVAIVKHGQWVEIEDFDGDSHWKCNVCGKEWYFFDGTPRENGCNYCPKCGAKMDGERGSNDGKQAAD